jgi:hypothetical protein
LVTDQRVARSCSVFKELGYDCIRMKLLFEQGPQFYLFFNIRLFFVLLFRKVDVLLVNDLDTLLPNYLISKLKGIPLIYDSHELFCEVPELQANPTKKRIWEWLEKRIVPHLKYCLTVNQSIADCFTFFSGEKYSELP